MAVPVEKIIRQGQALAARHGDIHPVPPGADPPIRSTPPEGVGGFHIDFGGISRAGTVSEIITIYQGGVRADENIVFRAKFVAGREDDPYWLRYKFRPDADWRTDFMSIS
jgi:hypothetical protein